MANSDTNNFLALFFGLFFGLASLMGILTFCFVRSIMRNRICLKCGRRAYEHPTSQCTIAAYNQRGLRFAQGPVLSPNGQPINIVVQPDPRFIQQQQYVQQSAYVQQPQYPAYQVPYQQPIQQIYQQPSAPLAPYPNQPAPPYNANDSYSTQPQYAYNPVQKQ